MTPLNDDLARGLRAVAVAGPREAPAWLEDRLRTNFRRRKLVRRGLRIGAVLAAVAAAVMIGPYVVSQPAPPPPSARLASVAPPVLPEVGIESHPVLVKRAGRRRPMAARVQPAVPANIATTAFYALPNAGDPLEFGAVVRVRLPRSALRLAGLPVNEERLAERIQADVLLGQDGTARAVRFVQ